MSRSRLVQPPALIPSVTDESGVPEGWTRTKLPAVCTLNPPKPPADLLPVDAPVTFVPMPAVDADHGAIANPSTRPFGEVRRGFTAFRDDDVIMAKITPCMENGKAAIARNLENGLGFGSTEFHVLRSNGAALPEYLFHFIRQESFRKAAEAEMTGSVGQKRVPISFLEGADLPLPPLAEQKRIVAKVEELLARVNAARERLARVPTILKRLRQSILAAACSGRLTADWRDALAEYPDIHTQIHPAVRAPSVQVRRAGRHWGAGEVPALTGDERDSLPSGWTWAKVGDLGFTPGDAVQVGPMSMKSSDFEEVGNPVLNVGCVQWGAFDKSKLNFMPEAKAREFERYRIRSGDILFTRSGTIGRCAIATEQEDGYLMTFHLLRARIDQRKCSIGYLYYALQGAESIRRQIDGAAIGSTRAGFNTNLLAGLDVPVPAMAEQEVITVKIATLFSAVDRIEACLAEAMAGAEKLISALLAKAFRGELVPTEADLARAESRDYESGTALLHRIRSEPASMPIAMKRASSAEGSRPRR